MRRGPDKIQEALRVAAEERRKKEEAKRLEMEAEEAARLEAERRMRIG